MVKQRFFTSRPHSGVEVTLIPWGNRSKYAALNVVPTGPTEMSIYHDGSGDRFVLRTDGIASVHVGADVGEMVTRPLRFTGQELVINYSTSAGGFRLSQSTPC